ncbi:class I SAM-dependent methyltransferase [bacterium]|nr:class I SAM-dependent methyltransferase [bacterium]
MAGRREYGGALWGLWQRLRNTLRLSRDRCPPDFDEPTAELWRFVRRFTMTGRERIFTLCRSVEYIVRNNIQGDMVECGVWKGGSMMAIARTLMAEGQTTRTLHLFDTFEGMAEPGENDAMLAGDGHTASEIMEEMNAQNKKWCYSPLEEVRRNMLMCGYDEDRLRFVKGKVEDTLPENAPDQIALLRLDTDWYESTYHELVHLYPRLSVGGVMVIDDYGWWAGQRKAVDQYVEENNLRLLLNRTDQSGRVCVKLDP